MWGNNRTRQSARISTLIGEQCTVQGDLLFTGGMHIEGKVVGSVTGTPDGGGSTILTLSEQGVVEGVVRVPQMVLNGTINGDVYAEERIELAPKARIHGDVHYRLLEMSIGAEVNGKLVHLDDDPPSGADTEDLT